MWCNKILSEDNKTNTARVQVKACSILPDLSSFGPKSQFDELVFLDLSNIENGFFKIFSINPSLIYNLKANKKETVKQQQEQGRRPRFSIYKEIILANNILPIFSGNINDL